MRLEAARRAVELDPVDAPGHEALRLGQQMPEETRGKFSYLIMAASLGALGRTEEARAAVDRLRPVAPGMTIERVVNEPCSDVEQPRLMRPCGKRACRGARHWASWRSSIATPPARMRDLVTR